MYLMGREELDPVDQSHYSELVKIYIKVSSMFVTVSILYIDNLKDIHNS